MAKIYNVRNGGDGTVELGMKNANSLNVYPTTIVATASGVALGKAIANNYELVNVAQTSGNDDFVNLLDELEVGTVLYLRAVSQFEIATETTAVQLNAGGGNDHIAVPANSTARCIKLASNNIVVQLLDDDGTIDIPSLTS